MPHVDITEMNRLVSNSVDAKDPGGRIGPYVGTANSLGIGVVLSAYERFLVSAILTHSLGTQAVKGILISGTWLFSISSSERTISYLFCPTVSMTIWIPHSLAGSRAI